MDMVCLRDISVVDTLHEEYTDDDDDDNNNNNNSKTLTRKKLKKLSKYKSWRMQSAGCGK
jgi:hypothetical protein